MVTQYISREERARNLLENPNTHILRINDNHYQMKSLATNRIYDIYSTESGWNCSCPDHIYRHVICKHALAISLSIQLRQEVRERNKTVIEEISCDKCPQCLSSKIVKHGIRHNKNYDLQRFSCRDCNNRFSFNLGFEKMSVNPKIITSAMQLYFTGESLRNVQKFIRLQGVNVAHSTIYQWIKKYIGLMEKYLEQITPQVSDKWRTDELYLKIKGDRKYLYAMMDDETRFWIAKQVSDTKYTEDVRPLFRKSTDVAGKRPKVLISDGARNFMQAHKKEWYSNYKEDKVSHIRHIHFKGDKNNNKMERLNGEIRDREKVMRGLKKDDSPIITGMQIHHNYIRTHMALNNETPAEACGIEVKGNDKWKTLIQNSSK